MSAPDAVRKASRQFYAALNSMLKGDPASLASIGSQSANVTTMHPVGGRQLGWASVRVTWEQVAKAMSDGQVKLNDQLIRVAGDMAYEVGDEQGFVVLGGQRISIDLRVTNLYRREAKGSRIVHHHTDVPAGMQEALRRLQAKH